MTEPRRPSSVALWTVILGGVTLAAYWAFLGWDTERDVDPVTGAETGPYQAWQVLGLGAVLAVLTFEAGRRGRPWLATLVVPAVLTASFSVDAATDPGSDGLWPIGAALVAFGSAVGTVLVAGLGAYLGRRRPR
ncbi:hypothetical protein [Plantactinospora sonchi]|uniref:Uncharacterized protein n=1 Tax=Plantactinospora sonchi TaxID=1544735 RepID=A0ABU7RT56_9ACTN